MKPRLAQWLRAAILAAPLLLLPAAAEAQQKPWHAEMQGASTTTGSGAGLGGSTSVGRYVHAATAPGQAATDRMRTSVASLSSYDADLPAPPTAKPPAAPAKR